MLPKRSINPPSDVPESTAAEASSTGYPGTRVAFDNPTQEEIAFELGLQGTKNLGPYIKSLESKHLISTKTSMGRKFYLIHDPRVGLQHLAKCGQLTVEELEEINNLCADLGQQPIHPAA